MWNPFRKAQPSQPQAPSPPPTHAQTTGLQQLASAPTSEKKVLKPEDAYEVLGFSYPEWKKWAILTSVFIVQLSMNFNAAIYSTAITGLAEQYGVTEKQAELGQMIFLVCYAFGCEMWAPWSEELGRKWVMQTSLFLVNCSQIGCALAPNFSVIMGMRAFGGLSSAGGSVTLGMVADLFEADNQQHAVNFVVFSSVLGSVLAPIAGGFLKTYVGWQWCFWTSLIFGFVASFIHFWVPETRSTVLLDRHARYLRKENQDPHVYGPNEIRGSFFKRITLKEICTLMLRPYVFLVTEPIVGFLSLLSGFSDALIFTGLDSFGMVMAQWHFNNIETGLSFLPLAISYALTYFVYMFYYRYNKGVEAKRTRQGKENPPERRLYLLRWLVLGEPIGLFIYGWVSLGPKYSHWIGPLIASGFIGIANYAIYQATIDYMTAAYGEYSASATGGNGFCRDLLAGIAATYARAMFTNIKTGTKWQLPIPSFILCAIGLGLVIPVFVFAAHGEYFCKRSPFAMKLAKEREEREERQEKYEPGLMQGSVSQHSDAQAFSDVVETTPPQSAGPDEITKNGKQPTAEEVSSSSDEAVHKV